MTDGDETAPGDEPPAKVPSKKYDQAFFLALAAEGKDAWNAWRRDPANKDVRVTFAGTDFSEARGNEINFEGFEFGDYANFSECKWLGAVAPGSANFSSAIFGNYASFSSATFGENVNFVGATFHDRAEFGYAAFGDRAEFRYAAFGDHAIFTAVTFRWVSFTGAIFGDDATFTGAAFGDHADFTGAVFGRVADFDQTHFKGVVDFTGTSVKELARNSVFLAALERRHREASERYGSGPDRFLIVTFASARFDGEANFSSRTFRPIADFTGARFYFPPVFDDADSASRIDFTGAHVGFAPPGKLVHWTEKSRIPFLLRTFRKIAEETKNHDLERDLYIEERKAERGVYWRQLFDELKKAPQELKKKLEAVDEQQREVWSNWRHRVRARIVHKLGIAVKIKRLAVHGFWIVVMGVYWALADYGRSPVRPLVCWLILSLIIFPWLYGQILPIPQKAGSLDADKYEQAVQLAARANAVPFVGPLTIDSDTKKFLFCLNDKDCHLIPTACYQWLVIGQSLISIVLIFFFGLALRNYFKIK